MTIFVILELYGMFHRLVHFIEDHPSRVFSRALYTLKALAFRTSSRVMAGRIGNDIKPVQFLFYVYELRCESGRQKRQASRQQPVPWPQSGFAWA